MYAAIFLNVEGLISVLLIELQRLTLDSIINGGTKFARLRNKFAHGDILEIIASSRGFYSYLPPKNELKRKYGVELPDNSVRMDLPGYVQLIKCLNFLLQWRENLRLGIR